jgi:SAM-dependent methyltransferase
MAARPVGGEARKSYALKLRDGFIAKYLSGAAVLDVGYRGYADGVVPIMPAAIGVDLDYPGYDGRRLPFPDESQDAVYSSHCLEHIADPVDAIREWFRVVKQSGYLIVVVPHQFLYEKKLRPPSRWNTDHQRFYTPGALLREIEAALAPNSYRLRHLADNDLGFDYGIAPDQHSAGCYEIELVVQKIARPTWRLDPGDHPQPSPPETRASTTSRIRIRLTQLYRLLRWSGK